MPAHTDSISISPTSPSYTAASSSSMYRTTSPVSLMAPPHLHHSSLPSPSNACPFACSFKDLRLHDASKKYGFILLKGTANPRMGMEYEGEESISTSAISPVTSPSMSSTSPTQSSFTPAILAGIPCRYGAQCRRADCHFVHPQDAQISSSQAQAYHLPPPAHSMSPVPSTSSSSSGSSSSSASMVSSAYHQQQQHLHHNSHHHQQQQHQQHQHQMAHHNSGHHMHHHASPHHHSAYSLQIPRTVSPPRASPLHAHSHHRVSLSSSDSLSCVA